MNVQGKLPLIGSIAMALLLSVFVLCFPSIIGAQDPLSASFANCRLGAAVVCNPVTSYNYASLNLGWYVSYGTSGSPLEPNGLEFAQIVRLHQAKNSWARDDYVVPYTYTLESPPDFAILRNQVLANPGSKWFIGNEPDRRDWGPGLSRQDEIVPALYARAYYEISQVIRQADPTAQIGPGGVVQGTPLRRKYLDEVWTAYRQRYGREWGQDIDVWNLHSFILNEKKLEWGAEIPAGLSDTQGIVLTAEDNANLTLFKQFVIDFRTWMKDKGERNKPLYVTEYGINMPNYYVSDSQVKTFMNGTLDYLLNTKNTSLGNPNDENRLVQRFMWYSLDDSKDRPDRVEDYADSLFSAITHLRQDFGNNWASYVANPSHTEAYAPRVNLLVSAETIPPVYWTGDPPSWPVTFTLKVSVYNNGNVQTSSGDGIKVDFCAGVPGSSCNNIAPPVIIPDVRGCGDSTTLVQSWVISPTTGTGPWVYPWYTHVEELSGEGSLSDNTATSTATIAVERANNYLPSVLQAY